jgi:hypothetical protein
MPGERKQERQARVEAPTTAETHALDRPASNESRGGEPRAEHRREIGGPKGPEPTRFGDWERAGRCIDF